MQLGVGREGGHGRQKMNKNNCSYRVLLWAISNAPGKRLYIILAITNNTALRSCAQRRGAPQRQAQSTTNGGVTKKRPCIARCRNILKRSSFKSKQAAWRACRSSSKTNSKLLRQAQDGLSRMRHSCPRLSEGALRVLRTRYTRGFQNIHLHGLVLDGVYQTTGGDTPVFHQAAAPNIEQLQTLLDKINRPSSASTTSSPARRRTSRTSWRSTRTSASSSSSSRATCAIRASRRKRARTSTSSSTKPRSAPCRARSRIRSRRTSTTSTRS